MHLPILRGASTKLIADLNKLYNRADGLARQRNRMVHDPWLAAEDKTVRVEVTAHKKLCYAAHEVDLTEMDELTGKIEES